jgi:hypothetical protein
MRTTDGAHDHDTPCGHADQASEKREDIGDKYSHDQKEEVNSEQRRILAPGDSPIRRAHRHEFSHKFFNKTKASHVEQSH